MDIIPEFILEADPLTLAAYGVGILYLGYRQLPSALTKMYESFQEWTRQEEAQDAEARAAVEELTQRVELLEGKVFPVESE